MREQIRSRRAWIMGLTLALSVMLSSLSAWGGASGRESQDRMTRDITAGLPVVIHVVVALCDNLHQGIVPVPAGIGNGQDPQSNLYWGAMYGVRTYLTRQAGWSRLQVVQPSDPKIQERIVLYTRIPRQGRAVPTYLVADAWDGAEMRGAIETFLSLASGKGVEVISPGSTADKISISAGGAAHLVTFVGHNGLMDFSVVGPTQRADKAPAASSMVLACASKPYFEQTLKGVGSHPLLLTTGLMAPEAYTLDAAIRSWVGGGTVAATREAAAQAYHKYQKCGLKAARGLFWGEQE